MNARSPSKPPANNKRQRAEEAGRRAELLAGAAYLLRGYQILERRFRAPGGEIDLVARKGRLIAFVEVKKRKTSDEAVFAVGPRNRERIERAGAAFLSRRPHFGEFAVRYDIAAVSGLTVKIIADAWRPWE